MTRHRAGGGVDSATSTASSDGGSSATPGSMSMVPPGDTTEEQDESEDEEQITDLTLRSRSMIPVPTRSYKTRSQAATLIRDSRRRSEVLAKYREKPAAPQP